MTAYTVIQGVVPNHCRQSSDKEAANRCHAIQLSHIPHCAVSADGAPGRREHLGIRPLLIGSARRRAEDRVDEAATRANNLRQHAELLAACHVVGGVRVVQ